MDSEHSVSEGHSKDQYEGDSTDEYESDFSDSDMDLSLPKTKTTKRGLTRLPKLRTTFTNSGGIKHKVTFDELDRFSGEYRSEFPSFLGDIVRQHVGFRFLAWKKVPKELKDKLWEEITRFYDIDACRRRLVMTRLGHLLRNFRRKVYAGYILPNLRKPAKLAKIPKQYRSMVDQSDWDKFVTYTQSEEFKGVSKTRKEARSKYIYDHHLGRGGYPYLRDKLVKNKELAIDEVPSRSLMWRKARENNKGEYKNAEVKDIADKIINSEAQIKDGDLNLDPGTDALTVVFGKEKGGFLKGVGYGKTSSRYWQEPRTKGSSQERIAQLEFQLHNERLEHEKKGEQLKALSMQMVETNNTLNQVLACLAAQGQVLPISTPAQVNIGENFVGSKHNTNATTSQQNELVNSVDNKAGSKEVTNTTMPPHANTSNLVQTEMVTVKKKRRKIDMSSHPDSQENIQKNTDSTNVPHTLKCALYCIDLSNRVANGTIYLSREEQSIHGVPLQDNCYRVSIDEVIKGAAFLPVETSDAKTVGDALNAFVAWPKSLVRCDQKVPDLQSNLIAKKQKKCYTTVNNLMKEARSKKKKKAT